MGDMVWLASYPKSGNTWLRVFLANLLNKGDQPIDINRLSISRLAGNRRDFDEILCVESSDMTRDEIERSRPECYRSIAAASSGETYVKLHDAYVYTSCGEPLIPIDLSSRAIYLVRNPLDVAVSFAHHSRKSIDSIIESMADWEFALCSHKDRLREQLEQRLLSWSGHVLSWLDQKSIPVFVMRYEDMLQQPLPTFAGCIEFLGLRASASEVERALAFSSFSALSAQEQVSGFRERRPNAQSFFRKGKVGDWRDNLNDRQIELILRGHSEVMRRLGYMPEV